MYKGEEMRAQPGQLFSLQGRRMLFVVLLTELPTNYEEMGGTENWAPWVIQNQHHGVSQPCFLLPALLPLSVSRHKPALRELYYQKDTEQGFQKTVPKFRTSKAMDIDLAMQNPQRAICFHWLCIARRPPVSLKPQVEVSREARAKLLDINPCLKYLHVKQCDSELRHF